jgi:hypothetical protein
MKIKPNQTQLNIKESAGDEFSCFHKLSINRNVLKIEMQFAKFENYQEEI